MKTAFGWTKIAALAGALALGTGLAGAAHAAADFCIDYYEGALVGAELVGKGFRLPGPGKCKPFMGVKTKGEYGVADVTGSACTSSDGSTVNFALLLSHRQYPFTAFAHVTLPLPLGAYGAMNVAYSSGYDGNAGFPTGSTCKSVVPIP